MSDAPKHQHGTPSWADLGTTDGEASVAFYAGVFGWEAENTPSGPAGTYTLLRQAGKDVAALYEQNDAMKQRGVPPLWLVYIAVDDASATAQKVLDAGGTVHAQPFDVAEAGRMALVQDPTGAMFGLWQAGSRTGAEVMHEPGSMDWFELATGDPEAAGSFYEAVLGWEVSAQEMDGQPYTTCSLDGVPVAGILPAEALGEGVAPNWTVYFAVENCSAVVEQVQQSGGELLSGPFDMPSVGQFAGLRDPQGATFGVLQQAATEEQAAAQEDGDDDSDGDGGGGESNSAGSDDEPDESASDEKSGGGETSEESEESDEGEKSEGSGKSDGDESDTSEDEKSGSSPLRALADKFRGKRSRDEKSEDDEK